jgi:hypothetical protein
VVATQVYDTLVEGQEPSPAVEHPAQLWSPVGGRVKEADIRALVDELTALAQDHGYPGQAGNDARIAFDRAAAQVLRKRMDLDWSEAGKRDVWSFASLVLLPHVTMWRFGTGNPERWVASDLTRHTWARLWWQAVVFAGHETLLDALSESDLNQLLERRRIGGDPRLVCAFAGAIVNAPQGAPRRFVIRDASLRLRRWLAFLDLSALQERQVLDLCTRLVRESATNFTGSEE